MGGYSLPVCVLFLVKEDCLLVQIYHLKFCLTSGGEGEERKRSFVGGYIFIHICYVNVYTRTVMERYEGNCNNLWMR